MEHRYPVTALREVRPFVSGAEYAHRVRADEAAFTAKEAYRDLTDVLIATSIVLLPEIAVVAAMVVVIKEMYIVMQIKKSFKRVQKTRCPEPNSFA